MLKSYLSKLLLLAVFCLFAVTSYAQLDSVTISAPAGVAGKYLAAQAAWGPYANGETGMVVLADNGSGVSNGCDPIVTDFTGKIAMIDRGVCGFVVKAANAQAKGAIAIIICNNAAATPDAVITMGGADCNVTIPGVMLSLNSCNTLKAELANGVMATLPSFAGPGEAIGSATELPGEGTYTVDSITGSTPVLTESTKARVFSIFAPMDGVMNVNSCLGGADTRVAVLTGCRNALVLVATNDDACEMTPGGDPYASSLDVLVTAGTKYIIVWDDHWSDDGFDFSVSFGPVPIVPITFTVDMAAETVAPDGVFIAGSFNGWTGAAMTNNGDGTWSYTADLTAGTTVQYKFQNGAGGWESTVTAACGVDDGFGGFNRVLSVPLTAFETPLVCFNSCGTCAPTDCEQPIVLLDDKLDTYTAGPIGPQADHWTTWSGAEGGAEEGIISTAQAQSGTNSLNLIGGGSTDCVLKLGNKITGRYRMSWDMFVPANFGGYSNIQKTEAPGTEWAYNLNFAVNGTGSIDCGVGAAASFTYPKGTWFKVIHIIDLDNDWAELHINNKHFFSWPFTNEAFATGGMKQLGGVNFYPRDANDNFFIDNVYYAAIPPVKEGESCNTAIPIEPGIHTVDELTCYGGVDQAQGRRSKWYTYTATANGYISVSTCGEGVDSKVWILKGDCANRLTAGWNDDECAVSPGGDLYAAYKEAYVTAGETYFIVFDDRWEDTGFDFELKYEADAPAGDFCATAIPVTGGTHTIDYFAWSAQTGPTFNSQSGHTGYNQSKWYSYTASFTGTARVFTCGLTNLDTRVWVYKGECTAHETLNLIGSNDDACGLQTDFSWPVVAGETYILEWDDLSNNIGGHDWTLEEPVPSVDVTFRVDLTNVAAVSAQGARMRFAGATTDVTMTNLGNKMFEVTLNLPQGATVNYNFKNGSVQVEPTANLVSCGVDNGSGGYFRTYTVPDAPVTLPNVCYGSCNTCDFVNSEEAEAFAAAIGINPNPASQQVNLTYNFDKTTDLKIRVTNTIGQVMMVRSVNNALSGNEKLDVASFPSGIYMVVFSNQEHTVAKRLVVE